jgi:hypothetical protein
MGQAFSIFRKKNRIPRPHSTDRSDEIALLAIPKHYHEHDMASIKPILSQFAACLRSQAQFDGSPIKMQLNETNAKLRLSVFSIMTLEKELEDVRKQLADAKQVSGF